MKPGAVTQATDRRPSVREEQSALTRRRILEACAELALRHGGFDDPEAFTYARVAELAGVSERTVYRAFPTKRELTAAFLDEAVLTGGEDLPAAASDLGAFLRRVSRLWEEAYPASPSGPADPGSTGDSGAAAATADDLAADRRRARDVRVEAALASELPATMAPAERRALAGVVRLLLSFRSIVQTSTGFDVPLADAGQAHAWAVDTLIGAIQRGEVAPWASSTASTR